MMRVILVRHGETAWNSERRIQGRTDIPLDRKGMRQAKLVGERLAKWKIDAVYSSDLKRAMSTARAIARRHPGVRLIKDELLRERNWGIVEGKRWDEIRKDHPDAIRAILSGTASFRIPEGESKVDVLDRAMRFLDSLSPKHDDGVVVVVSHGGLCATVLKHILGIEQAARPPFFMENCAISVLDYYHEEKSWFVRTLNDMAHLEALANETKPYG